ncbi:MAG: glycoside hydrolase family 2 TIM barrel-domain containing protein [Luteolibacter sp.]|uniref:glycoside hydrolase family 2 TIM barrel-domain containing protein n=1 Tax=Luteolibacter sp. TaxID=1962973 RepID=UPI003266D054
MRFNRAVKPIIAIFLAAIATASARTVVSLDADWAFFQGDAKGAENPEFNTASWRKLDVPHDWSIEGKFDEKAATTGAGAWMPSGVAWYRKEISLPPEAKGQRVWVEFDGVMQNSDVWFNGKLLGHRPSGYVGFRYDLTDLLKPSGPNTLVVKADTAEQPASRWYSGAGIYRHVRLVTAHPVHVEPWGVYVTTPEANEAAATVKIQTTLVNSANKPGKVTLRSALVGPDGKSLALVTTEADLSPGKSETVSQQIKVPHPRLWSLESPEMNKIVTRITAGETVLDEVTTPFGIRQAEFKSDTGFWLNGKNFKLKGVCLHQDGGAAGVAVPLGVWERRLKSLRELGVNAIRTAHTPPAPEFLDLCDRMGFLVMDEFFDCWTKGKNKYDYHLFFKEWSSIDLRDGILRDRNHPSVILYSVGNEIHDTPQPEIAKPILRGLVDVCHATDPSRSVTQALFRPNVSGDYKNGLADMLDVIGTNYRDKELLDAWKDKSGRKIVGTEQGHERATWLLCRDNPQHSGQFLWCGIDYLGESRSWPLTVFNGGLLDRAGFVQPRGLERQSWWSDKPMVRALRRIGMTSATPADPGYEALEWNRRQVLFADWTPTATGDHEENVEVYSNADEVELFLNDKSLGKQNTRKDSAAISWKVPYQPGTLKAVARTKGKEVASDLLRTAGKPVKARLVTDHDFIGIGFDDVANVVINLLDENDTVVPAADNLIKFSVSGPGKIIGVDSGNIVSTEPFVANERKAYQGTALAILRATAPGKITLTATVDGLPPATLEITAKP